MTYYKQGAWAPGDRCKLLQWGLPPILEQFQPERTGLVQWCIAKNRVRDAEVVEGRGRVSGCLPLQSTGGCGERRKLSSAGSGAEPWQKTGFGAF